ncbi:CusA/CzcA family heavy metal efflux RND transporter [Pendulispora brunnea]|uniref:CusA/CzcA family heavy metal efflux RND transporter n=1 Tax=Pendulispora brunnea TaxID=2905690 RepID=A0ABZ2KDX9_9BACT
MIDRLIELSVRNRVLIILLSFVFVLLGAFASTRVPIDAVPDVTNVQVQVLTQAPALGPLDVETYVTFPVEMTMAGTPGLTQVRSNSRAGISVVTLVFDDDTNLLEARQLVAERIPKARDAIPAGYGEPEIGPMSSGLGEVLHFEVGGKGRSLMELRTILDWQIAPRLRLVPGVVEVNTFGGEAKTLEAELDPQRLAAARVGVTQVVEAIERNHLAVGGAYMVDGRENITLRGEGRVTTVEDFGNVVIETRGDRTPLYLKDLGQVHYAPRVRYGAVTRDGRGEIVVGVALMRRGANSGEVVDDTKRELAEIQKSLPEGVTIDTYYDRTELVHKTIHTVSKNLLEASVLVIVVLFVTLANWRAGTVVALSIPLALVGVFIGMWLGGVSGNLLSLGAIDFGLVVDGAVIIIENAQRHLAEKRAELGRTLTDAERQETVVAAAREVRGATAFGEAIIALVYVPILALSSVEGRMFRPMALTVLFALAAAFVLSLTLVPALASMLLSRDATDHPSPLVRAASRIYEPILNKVLVWPKVTAAIAVAAFAGSLVVGSQLGREFLPKLDEGTLVIPSIRLPSVSLEASVAQTTQVEKLLKESFPEVTSVICRTGRAEIAIDPMGINMTDIYVMLKPRDEWTTAHDRESFIAAVDEKLSNNIPGIGLSYSQPIEMNTNDLLAGIDSDVAVQIYGRDLAQLKQLGDQAVQVLRAIPGAKDVRAEMVAGLNALTVHIDRPAIARQGLDAKEVLDTVQALGGIEVGEIAAGAERYPIQVRLSPDARKSAESISALPIRTENGALLPLGQLADVKVAPGASEISRERLSRRISVQANVRGRDLASFVETAKVALERDVKMPAGYFLAWAGEYERLQSATARLLVVVPVALLLIVVLLVATFGKVKQALLIFSNVPMSVSGGVLALALRGMPFSISAGVGFIALFGVAVLNGLVLVSSIEKLRARGMPLAESVRLGAEGRLRPVLTTALVASLGFLPMALAEGAGAEVQRPLATVVIGGIASATLLTLLVLPAIYEIVVGKELELPAPAEEEDSQGGGETGRFLVSNSPSKPMDT